MSETTKSCELIVDSAAAEISVSGISGDSVIIGYKNDIDLTDLVMILSRQIDTGSFIAIKMPAPGNDEKLALVLTTINDIVEAYNASLKQPDGGYENEGGDITF